MKKELTIRQRLFVAEYIVDQNGTQAAIRAGYTDNEAAAAVHATRLLRKAKIRNEIDLRIGKLEKKCEITAEKVLKRLWRLANADLAQFYDQNGNLKNVHDIPKAHRYALMGIEIDEIWDGYGQDRTQTGETKKVKLADKIRALELLGKYLKLFTDKVEVSAKVSIADRMKAGRERAMNRGKPPGGFGNPTN